MTGKLSKLVSDSAEKVDRSFGWARLPTIAAIPVLIGLRDRLRAKNLYDTGRGPLDKPPFEDPDVSRHLGARMINGTYNDLDDPLMGSLGSRFGRNVPLEHTYPDDPKRLLDPNPRLISRRLLTRESFQPATTLNLLAGAWIQFEVHDWLSHDPELPDPWEIPLEKDDPWPEHPMKILRTKPDPSPDASGPPTYRHGRHPLVGRIAGVRRQAGLRRRPAVAREGRLRIDDLGLPPEDLQKFADLSGVAGNFWVGLAILHSLFMREHNAICERLAAEYPEMSDQELYDKARLVNAALMAKVHTVDWTPAIIAHPTTVLALRTNWYGLLGEHLHDLVGHVTDDEVLHGIPGSQTNHHGVPYSLTEEFVAVYRMHPLIPDQFTFRSVDDDRVLAEHELPDVGVLHVRERLSEVSMADLFYSFGRSHPGAITLHNYPKYLQHFDRADGSLIDLASIDILRVRERGVPRYNEFRRLFHMNPVSSFEELTDNPVWAEELRRIYGDVERVDLMIGMYAEPKPKGFGFSDTAFRVFILMASRRLESDRFFTRDFRPEVYTQAGFDWVNENTMRTILLRHFPELEPALEGVENPFAPWTAVGG